MPQVYIKREVSEQVLELGHIGAEDYNRFVNDAVVEKVERDKEAET